MVILKVMVVLLEWPIRPFTTHTILLLISGTHYRMTFFLLLFNPFFQLLKAGTNDDIAVANNKKIPSLTTGFLAFNRRSALTHFMKYTRKITQMKVQNLFSVMQ